MTCWYWGLLTTANAQKNLVNDIHTMADRQTMAGKQTMTDDRPTDHGIYILKPIQRTQYDT